MDDTRDTAQPIPDPEESGDSFPALELDPCAVAALLDSMFGDDWPEEETAR